MDTQAKLIEAREERRPVRLIRTPARAHELRGFVIAFDNWLLIHNEESFALNGYSLVPIAQVAEVGFFAPESDYAQACRQRELHLQVGISETIDLSDTRRLLRSIRRLEITLVVESEHEHSDAFFVGRILRVYRSSAVIACIDASGAWTAATQTIAYRDLTRIGIGDRYCAMFQASAQVD